MSSENIEIQYPETLESFEKEVQRYKPIDMIDFCTEYFECLQKGIPLRSKDLSGLKKFKLTPEDEAVVRRLNIPQEDLVRVINRRKIKSHEEILNDLNTEFDKYFDLIEKNGSLNDEEMHNYLKLKTNTFRDYEFIRFLKDIESLQINKNHHRIFFTKLYNLTDEEKKLIFKFCDLDYKIINDKKTQSWKEILILLNECNKHTYAPYDEITQKIEKDIKLYEEKGQRINLDVFDSIFEQYKDVINNIKNYDESQLYNFILKQYHYKRVIIYDILKAKVLGNSPDKAEIENLYNLYDKIFFKSFAYLTELDYYDFILSCFIPLIKESNKTSLEHREMESYLNHLIPKIPQIYNINFEEEKNVYYNIECVKYFLNKQNNIKTVQFKKIFIQIIQIFSQKVKELKKELNLQTNNEILKMFKTKYELIQLQYNEFYPKLVEFTEKMVQIAIKYDLGDGSNKEIENSLISQFKSNEKLDQILITNSMMMIQMFESDKVKQKGINDTIMALVKAMSIPEMALEIREHAERDKEIIPRLVLDYYNNILKLPRFDFNKLKYLTFKAQVQICNLIIRNNRNLQNTAIIYQNNNIQPYIDYDYMIEELYNFDLFYFKICFEKSLKEQLEKDFNDLVNKFQEKFPKIDGYIQNLTEQNNTDYIEKFKGMNNFEQKLILTYMNFSDDLRQEKKYEEYITILSVIYLKDKIDFINKEFNINLTQEEKDEKKYNFENNLYLQSLALELKHVNFLIYLFVKYDRAEDYLIKFTNEEKSIISDIELALNYKKTRIPKDCLSFKEMISIDDMDKLLKDLELYHPVVYTYVNEYKDEDNKNNLTDFKIFNDEEREIIIKILEKKSKSIKELKNYHNNANDKLSRTLKHIMLSEKDKSLNLRENSDLRFYYRKTLLYIEKQMTSSMKECVSLVLDYTYDPNNTYLKSDFLHFTLSEQLILLQDILCRQKILDYHTMYYEQNACAFIEEYLKIYLDICSRRNNNEHFHKRLEDDYNYLLKYFNDSIGVFIEEIHDVNNQFVYQFLNNFSIDERKAICLFLELYAALKNRDIYNSFKDRLQSYVEDLTYNDRIKMINNQLDMIINNEIVKSTFMTTAEDIKETAYEINYLIESITTLDDKVDYVEPYLIYLYETFPKELKEITIKTIKCIREQNTNKVIGLYFEEFEKKLKKPSKPSIFISVKEAFEKIDKSLIPNHDNSDKKPKYDKLKTTLQSLCEDLFKFVDDCKIGRFNLRKIKAISKEKVEIIKLVMNCDYLIQPNKKLKDASHTLELVKFD